MHNSQKFRLVQELHLDVYIYFTSIHKHALGAKKVVNQGRRRRWRYINRAPHTKTLISNPCFFIKREKPDPSNYKLKVLNFFFCKMVAVDTYRMCVDGGVKRDGMYKTL